MSNAFTRMTGGDAIVEALLANGVDTVFGLPGAQLYPLFDALQQRAGRIAVIGARHEQACGYMAFGYARATGRPGVFAVVPGPGVLNTAAALCTAAGSSAPVLCLTGQVPSAFLGRGRGHLHELPDQLRTLRSFIKWAVRIERPADAPDVLAEAFRQMLGGRPGPVAVEMAWDTMAAAQQVGPIQAARLDPPPPPLPEDIERAAAALDGARAPMLFVGSGAQHAAPEVLALAEALQAPVVAFRGGRGIVPETHRLGLSSYAASRLWPEIDVAVGIGTRLELPYMRWTGMMTLIDAPAPPPTLIRIDIDPAEMRRLQPQVGVVADAKRGSAALLAALQRRTRPPSDLARIRAEAASATARVQPHVAMLQAIRAALPPDGIFVDDICQAGFTALFAWNVLAPRTYVSAGYQGTLGSGFMTALGAKAAQPGRPVVCITGDGGFMFGVQELATAAQYGLGVVTVLFNNGAFGNVKRDQQTAFGGRLIGSELRNPDFAALVGAFGIAYARADTPAALEAALRPAIASGAPALIEVRTELEAEVSPWAFIHPKGIA